MAGRLVRQIGSCYAISSAPLACVQNTSKGIEMSRRSLRVARASAYACFVAIATAGLAAPPDPIAPERLILKTSLKLRGTSPTRPETQAFVAAVHRDPERFDEIYSALLRSYVGAQEFSAIVEQFHAIWFRVPAAESAKLAAFIVVNDRPYFELFDKSYAFLDGRVAPRYQQAGIVTAEPLPEAVGDWRAVRLAPSETRYRSVLSNLDMLDRFPDTPSNKNRARANQIFRTFLCETLSPSGKDFAASHLEEEDPHGTNPECIGCHYRLDPLARFFDRWRPPYANTTTAWYDVSQSAAGKLIVKLPEGQRTEYAGRTETDLGRFLKVDPSVKRCIVQKVWEFAFGPGVQLDPTVATGLVTSFSASQNFKSLLTDVLKHPYFWSMTEPPPLRFDDVKASLQVCTTCHSPSGEALPRFDPKNYPFSADPSVNVRILTQIWGAVNYLPGYRPMPKDPIPALPPEALRKIREWVSAGAYSNEMSQTLDEAQIKEVLHE